MKTDFELTETNLSAGDRSATVTVCHKTGNGQYQALDINRNALQAHLNHGDYLPDADGDGYTAIGACTGTMNDCDDSNPDVHPGAAEICGNYIDDDCDGCVDSSDPDSDCAAEFSLAEFEAIVNMQYDYQYNSNFDNCYGTFLSEMFWLMNTETYTLIFVGKLNGVGFINYIDIEGNFYEYTVGCNLTEEEYEAARELILEEMEANPLPSICSLFRSSVGGQDDPITIKHRKQFSDQIKNMPPKVKQLLSKSKK